MKHSSFDTPPHTQEIAHDVRNILCVLSARVRLLGKTLTNFSNSGLGQSAIEHQINCLNRALAQASELCESLIEDPLMAASMTADLTAVVHECCDMISPLLGRQVELSISMEHDVDLVQCDALKLNRVILNLMKNGMESMVDRGGRLSLSTGQTWLKKKHIDAAICRGEYAPGAYTYVEVKDEGCGLDIASLKSNDLASIAKHSGAHGHGLKSIVNTIHAFDGLMQVSSQVNQGTVFRILFPCASVGNLLPPIDFVSHDVTQLIDNITERSKRDSRCATSVQGSEE